jgi:hypothetical protein
MQVIQTISHKDIKIEAEMLRRAQEEIINQLHLKDFLNPQ